MQSFDRRRYRRVRFFFFKVSLHVLVWDVLLNRPFLRVLRTAPVPRWQKLAEEFRELALDLGGVLIKLGQYLRTRVDVLPAPVAAAFAGLQDAVPAADFAAIEALIEADFGRPLREVFPWIDHRPLGSASLGQVHRARLPDGQEVAVKVLRPGIRTTVETDLAVLARFIRRLKHFERVRKQTDLDWLANEFSRVTRRELDTTAEGENCERFGADFADDAQVVVPKVYWELTRPNVLTMENVAHFRVDELPALEATGVARSAVARKIANVYLRQFFRTHFVHVDPHEGNLFIRPLPLPGELDADGMPRRAFAPGEPVPAAPARDFQLIFVDFGMVITIPKRLRPSLRLYAIGIGTRDARRIVEAYVASGLLGPGTDLARLEEMTEGLLNRFEGTLLGQMKGVDLDEYVRFFADEYSDLLFENPFRIPGDMLFVFRAMGILSGVIAKMDADLDLSLETVPLARRLLDEDTEEQLQKALVGARDVALSGWRTVQRFDDFLTRSLRGGLTVRSVGTPEVERGRRDLQRLLRRLGWFGAAFGLVLSGVLWRLGDVLLVQGRGGEPGPAGPLLVGVGLLLLVVGALRTR